MKNERSKTGIHTFYEIKSQAESWRGVFPRIDNKTESLKKLCKEAEDIVFMGCGSAFNIPNAVAPIFQKYSEKTCRAVHASELMIHPELFLNKNRKNLVIGYSRSGDTTESVNALKQAKNVGAETIAIVCFKDSQMAQISDIGIILEEAVEKSVTTTRSLTSMILAGYYLAAVVNGNNDLLTNLKILPDIAEEKMDQFHGIGKKISLDRDIKKYAFVGSGSYYGLAREAQLKFKEMVLLPSDSYISLDYQHGPMSNVDKNMLVTILVSDSGMKYDLELAGNMKALGGKVFIICDRNGENFQKVSDYTIELNTGLGDGVRDILYMPALQYMAYYKSMSLGYDPDNPKNLSYHVELAESS
jgi:glucosamine--fructose-6-phosphate aminotransferase (isomerizing)